MKHLFGWAVYWHVTPKEWVEKYAPNRFWLGYGGYGTLYQALRFGRFVIGISYAHPKVREYREMRERMGA